MLRKSDGNAQQIKRDRSVRVAWCDHPTIIKLSSNLSTKITEGLFPRGVT
jgi:hypothetical protein